MKDLAWKDGREELLVHPQIKLAAKASKTHNMIDRTVLMK
jgi:hypothetical protein